jgi:hypothetical protein
VPLLFRRGRLPESGRSRKVADYSRAGSLEQRREIDRVIASYLRVGCPLAEEPPLRFSRRNSQTISWPFAAISTGQILQPGGVD